MTTAGAPAPGTVDARLKPPRPVEEALRLVGDGHGKPDAVQALAGRFDADELRAAQLWWVRRMPKSRWDDHTPSAVLGILEEAVKAVDPKLPAR